VSAYGNADRVCDIDSWYGGHTYVTCTDATGTPADSAFTFSYATTGPTIEQQGAHAWYNGIVDPMYSAALPMDGCSSASVTGSGAPLASLVVTGNLGSWDSSPFVRASFATSYGIGYCKVESITTWGAPPSTTAETKIRCYTPAGAPIATPRLTFTHVTSDAYGPC
jgi:hypothetical protein